MIKGWDIIAVAGEWRWDEMEIEHHLSLRLARHNRVLFIELKPSGRRGIVEIRSNLYLFSPIPRARKLVPLRNALMRSRVASSLHKLGFSSPLLFIFDPAGGGLIGVCGEVLSVYFKPRLPMSGREEGIASQVSLCIAPSQRDYERMMELNLNAFYVPPGIDLEHFSKALLPGTAVPPELEWIPRPRIGVRAVSGDLLDLDLLERLIDRHPEWSFVLLGEPGRRALRLALYPNVYRLGAKPYEELPGYLKGLDVAISPYILSDLTLGLHPVEVKEHLAAGLPVVATDLPELRKLADVAHLAGDIDGFEAGIRLALAERGRIDLMLRGREKVMGESWEERVELLSEIISRYIAARIGRLTGGNG